MLGMELSFAAIGEEGFSMNAVLAFGGKPLGPRELLASRYKGYGALCNPLAGTILHFLKKTIPSLLL